MEHCVTPLKTSKAGKEGKSVYSKYLTKNPTVNRNRVMNNSQQIVQRVKRDQSNPQSSYLKEGDRHSNNSSLYHNIDYKSMRKSRDDGLQKLRYNKKLSNAKMSQSVSNTSFGYASNKEIQSRIKQMNHHRKVSTTSSSNLYYKTTTGEPTKPEKTRSRKIVSTLIKKKVSLGHSRNSKIAEYRRCSDSQKEQISVGKKCRESPIEKLNSYMQTGKVQRLKRVKSKSLYNSVELKILHKQEQPKEKEVKPKPNYPCGQYVARHYARIEINKWPRESVEEGKTRTGSTTNDASKTSSQEIRFVMSRNSSKGSFHTQRLDSYSKIADILTPKVTKIQPKELSSCKKKRHQKKVTTHSYSLRSKH